MPHYLLSICYPAGAVQPEPDELARITERVTALSAQMEADGAWVFGGGLHDPSSATVVDASSGELAFTDGPYIESKEVVGGLTIITADDLDEALRWAGRLTEAIGVPVEVRPFVHGG